MCNKIATYKYISTKRSLYVWCMKNIVMGQAIEIAIYLNKNTFGCIVVSLSGFVYFIKFCI